jgi:hypothetical protein
VAILSDEMRALVSQAQSLQLPLMGGGSPGSIDGKLVITHGLTGRMAEWLVAVADLGARLGNLTAPHA